MNKKTLNRKKTFLIIWVLLLLGAVFLLNRYFNGKTEVEYTKYLVIGKENVFVVYDDKISLKIPQDTYVGNDKKVEDYLKDKDYSELFQVIKSIFPEDLEGYVVPKRNLDIATAYSINIPATAIKLLNSIPINTAYHRYIAKLHYYQQLNKHHIRRHLITKLKDRIELDYLYYKTYNGNILYITFSFFTSAINYLKNRSNL